MKKSGRDMILTKTPRPLLEKLDDEERGGCRGLDDGFPVQGFGFVVPFLEVGTVSFGNWGISLLER